MRNRIGLVSVFLFVLALPAFSGVLVSYSFDDGVTDTGPDTFAVFQNAKGHVRLSSQIHYSGYRSIELRDVKGDGNFPELQGYFTERKNGTLFFHFSMLVVNPEEKLHVALAGPSHFTMTPDGIGFWLKTVDGVLHHVSDSIPKRLLPIRPFVWYVIDVRYDIPRGRYDLTIREEGNKTPLVALTDQSNATSSPGSSVDKFSFVGEVYEDDSDVTYYVDDVMIGTEENVIQGPFLAPGRRKLFIDRWRDAQTLMAGNPSCPPVLSFADFGLHDADVEEIRSGGHLALLNELVSGTGPGKSTDLPAALQPLAAWRSICAQMKKDPEAAARAFAEHARLQPTAPIFAISEVLALIRAKRTDDAMRRWVELEPLLHNDPRYGMLAASAGMAGRDFGAAERWLREPAEKLAAGFTRAEVRRFWEEGGAPAISALQSALPDQWSDVVEDKLIADQYFFVLLWKGEHDRAARFAQQMSGRLDTFGVAGSDWLERAGDAVFLGGSAANARKFYESALAKNPGSYWPTTKLADVFFTLGDSANEKLYRQKVYGALKE